MLGSIHLGIDVGTTSTKCLAVASDGRVLAFAQKGYGLSHPQQGWAEQDPQDYWTALVDVVRRVVAECAANGWNPDSVESMAMSTQGDTLILADENGTPLMPAISWMDTRAGEECNELVTNKGASFWYRETGQSLTPYSSACAIRWVQKNRPELWSGVRRVCSVSDYLAVRLCGRFVTDTPSASWSPLFSPVSRMWSASVLDTLDIAPDMIPEAVESGAMIDPLLPEVADELGIGRGAVLVAGAFDQAAAAYGSGAAAGGRSVLSCGTAWVLYSVSSVPVRDPRELTPTCCHTSESEWGLVLPFTGGSAYDWFNKSFTEPEGGSERTGSDPLTFIPHLYGALSPDWRGESRGSLLGLTMSHTREDVRIALMRGLAFETRRNVEAAEALGEPVRSIRMVGGAGKSDIWPQIIANILNRPIEVTEMVESACYGAAKLAVGESARDWPVTGGVWEHVPEAEQVEQEERQYYKYLRFYEALLELYSS